MEQFAENDDWQERLEHVRSVCRQLETQYGNRLAVDELRNYAHDPKWEVRMEIAMVLQFISPLDIGDFLFLLEDGCSFVQEHARRSMEVRKKDEAKAMRRVSAEKRDSKFWNDFARSFGCEASQKAREYADRSYSDAVACITHDMRALLRPVFPVLDRILARDEKGLEPSDLLDSRKDVGYITEQLQFLRQILDDSRELAMDVDCSNPRTDTVMALLKEALAEVMDERLAAGKAADAISVAIDCPKDVTVTAALSQLVRAFRNLLKNAVEACPEEGGKVDVTVVRRGKRVTVKFHDNGPGIPPEDLKAYNTFKPRCATRKSGGTGFGLAIANAKIKALGGLLLLESENGNGVTAVVTLPVNGGES